MSMYQHFRPEEQGLIKEMEQYATKAESQFRPVLTPFLDPRAQYILEVVSKQFQDIKIYFNGGNESSERKRAIIAPDYFSPSINDFEISLIEVKYPDKFVSLNHRNLLGTLMSTGITREQLGDIIVNEKIQFVVTQPMVSYLMTEITKIKGAAVQLNVIDFSDMIDSNEHFVSQQTVVSSLRLDNIIQVMTKKSRAFAQKLIEAEKVKVNHTLISKTSYTIEAQDLLSIKGYGRAKVTEIGDRTKKDKIRITYETLFK